LQRRSRCRWISRNAICSSGLTLCVIFATLVVQGLTLPAVIRALGVREDTGAAQQELRARKAATQSALDRIDQLREEDWTRQDSLDRLRAIYDFRHRRLAQRAGALAGEDEDLDARRRPTSAPSATCSTASGPSSYACATPERSSTRCFTRSCAAGKGHLVDVVADMLRSAEIQRFVVDAITAPVASMSRWNTCGSRIS